MNNTSSLSTIVYEHAASENAALLNVSLIQPDLIWLKPSENLQHLSLLLSYIPEQTDIVVLPEMFTSGFTQNPEPVSGHQVTVEWMRQQAALYNVAIVGSIACEMDTPADEVKSHIADSASTRFLNRLYFVTPDGEEYHYDKRHLFTMGDEHKRYQAGNERCIVVYKGWRVLLTVCYDLRFPVFCRNQQEYDAMLCVANWPVSRRHPWRTLLQARAIENQAYVLGVNRVGVDGNGLDYNGDSLIVDAIGHIMADGGDGQEQCLHAVLSKAYLYELSASFPVLKDADLFELL